MSIGKLASIHIWDIEAKWCFVCCVHGMCNVVICFIKTSTDIFNKCKSAFAWSEVTFCQLWIFLFSRHDDDDVLPRRIQWSHPLWLLENLISRRPHWLHGRLLPPRCSLRGIQVPPGISNERRVEVCMAVNVMETHKMKWLCFIEFPLLVNLGTILNDTRNVHCL